VYDARARLREGKLLNQQRKTDQAARLCHQAREPEGLLRVLRAFVVHLPLGDPTGLIAKKVSPLRKISLTAF
jgi:hypothetical protein